MQRIALFLFKYNGVFAFFILQIIALTLYFSRNSNPEKKAFLSSANGLIGNLYETSSNATRYWNLSAVNDSLARTNAELLMKLPSSKFTSLVQVNTIKDTTLQQQYQYFEAKVVNNTIHRRHNFLTINRGRRQGVRANSGVLNGNGTGVVGVVQKVSNNFGVVMSLLNIDTRISAKILRNNNFGILVWDGEDAQHLRLESVPKHAEVHEGDTIVTSGYSTIFPEGILIGKVDSVTRPPGLNFYDIKVSLFNDMNNVQYVYVVSDLLKEERLILEEATTHE
ncbi:MAG: rod shape-determining protein MreC [Aureispira sp.]